MICVGIITIYTQQNLNFNMLSTKKKTLRLTKFNTAI